MVNTVAGVVAMRPEEARQLAPQSAALVTVMMIVIGIRIVAVRPVVIVDGQSSLRMIRDSVGMLLVTHEHIPLLVALRRPGRGLR